MSRLVSAEEARRLLADVSHTLPWRDYKYGILRSDDVTCSYVVSWDYAVSEHDNGDAEQLFTEIIMKAPDLAATVIALSEERDRLRDVLACERGEWAPEGWTWLVDDNFSAMLVGTVRDAAGWPVTVRRTVPRGWSADGGRTVHSFALLAAKAIEFADRAATPK